MTFLNNFLEQLCSEENLIDISSTCKAEQSSLSKWSKPNDASRVLSDHSLDFANHTEPELNPWLTIDLQKNYYPAFIIVQNTAKKPYDELASGLLVEYSDNNLEYSLLHKGELHFGHFPDSLPLILPLKSKVQFRFLRLSLLSKTKRPLHLKRVNILIHKKPDLTQKQNDVVFYSSRTDGLGERLKSLLNAMVLSKHFDSQFKFTWNNPKHLGQFHAVDDSEKIFSPTFLSKYLTENIPSEIHELDKRPNFFSEKLAKKQAIRTSQRSLISQIPALENYLDKIEFAKAFNRIEFNSKINAAIHLAKDVELPKGVMALHLRAGDIIYGKYRHGNRYTNKVISYAQADFIISALKKVGTDVLIFGQNNDVCRYLADKFGSLYFGDSKDTSQFNSTQLAIFDMVLMSRTKHIFSGNSGFAQLSELISETKISLPEEYFDVRAMSTHISSLLNSNETKQYDSYQNAFSCWHYIYRYKDIVGLKSSITLLEKAFKYDPDNIFYLLVLCIFHYQNGSIRKSQSVIRNILKRKDESPEKVGSYNQLKTHKYHDGKGAMYNYRNHFVQMAQANVKGATELAKDFE